MAKLLLVEDDRMFAELIRHALREEGHSVDLAADYAEARGAATGGEYDGILLDVTLPDGSGLNLARELRQEGSDTPILMITGNDGPRDVVQGLDAGADDYLTKPLDDEILKARVRALVRRREPKGISTLAFGGIVVDRAMRRATIDGQRVSLAPREFTLLAFLVEHAEHVVARAELLEKVWDLSLDPNSNVIDVHVARLRGKLREHNAQPTLVTVRGTGYVLTLGARADG
ncbi:response regulator transcription factor [Roseisolibacter sp. H3M3-2]|uniref:response regulator transcription factor n=1 Tax=Roseisolibacter sp. H3M3-2 TaxID=3031323 RepID=UPI0023DC1A1F|nr:response regulator transcription factor [Roseisolibacter sp. H3M3-2]MDF1504437.1 response regulator transcription factor [Roseisolibacter sp. H3M3-2]